MSTKTLKKILVINTGSSSLKFMLFDMEKEEMLAKGLVERIGTPSSNMVYQRAGEAKHETPVVATNHTEALSDMCKVLTDKEIGVLVSLSDVDAIGHRTVHGGERFSGSVAVTDEVKDSIRACSVMAPLHNPANLEGILACEQVFPGTPNVAVFDTAFHQTMPSYTYMYAVPKKCYTDYGVRKYGFHGTSHKFVAQRAAEILGKPLDELKLITCHMGNGSSFAAIKNGKVLDTTMGMTPLAGLIMGTRSGDIDPGAIFYLARKGFTVDQIDEMLNKKSGLLAIAGTGSGDMRELVNASEEGSADAINALKMFAHRAVLYIGGYFAALGGADAIILTGGIGENSVKARQVILEQLAALGIELDPGRNKDVCFGREGLLTTAHSRVPAYVIPTNEELMIARETFTVLAQA